MKLAILLKYKFKIILINIIFYTLLDIGATAQAIDNETIFNILTQADSITSELKSISYWCDFRMKYLSIKDTTFRRGICYLQKDEGDTLKIKINLINITEGYIHVYNRGELLQVSMKDSSSLFVDCNLYGDGYLINRFSNDFIQYNLFIENYYKNLLLDTLLEATKLELVVLDSDSLYAISFFYRPDDEVSNKVTTRYFKKDNCFPVGTTSDLKFYGMHQYKYNFISNYIINHSLDEIVFDLRQNIIDSSKLNYYLPPPEIDPLPIGSVAPNFSGLSTIGDSIELHKIQSDIIILDFWFRACWPCIKTGEILNEIFDTYPSDVVKIIGINPVDTDDQINDWIDSGKVKYENLIDKDKSIKNVFRIDGWPTVYILNSRFEIIHTLRGYHGEKMSDIINDVISNHRH
jgi:peroxiredoxin